MAFATGIEMAPHTTSRDRILTPEAVGFLDELHRRFNPRRLELLEARVERRERIAPGGIGKRQDTSGSARGLGAGRGALDDRDAKAGARQLVRAGRPDRPRPDDDRVGSSQEIQSGMPDGSRGWITQGARRHSGGVDA